MGGGGYGGAVYNGEERVVGVDGDLVVVLRTQDVGL